MKTKRPISFLNQPTLYRFILAVFLFSFLFEWFLVGKGSISTRADAPAMTFTVTNANDSGDGSLRQAILDANANMGLDTIAFAITGKGGRTISPLSALPDITDPVIIDGYTQPGALQNTNVVGGLNTVLMIEIDGSAAGAGVNGLNVAAGGSVIRGLVINRFTADGIFMTTAGGNRVEGNFLGTDPSGTLDLGNGGNGAATGNGSPNNTIGGTTPDTRNLISGNEENGVLMQGTGVTMTHVQGNLIGTDISGTSDLGNTGVGVYMLGSPANTVGGTVAGTGNVISGNDSYGVRFESTDATGNLLQGNFIGTDASGTLAIGNGAHGVILNGATSNTIGGTSAAARNVISGNNGHGIEITGGVGSATNTIQGNLIGTKVDGASALGNTENGVAIFAAGGTNNIGGPGAGAGNTIAFNAGVGVRLSSDAGVGNRIQSNSIFSNGSLGIDLLGDGVTPNDLNDVDTGPNNLQNFPILTSAVSTGGSTTILGTLNSTPNTPFRVEFYSSPTCDPSGNGQGHTWLGFKPVSTVGNNGVFTAVLPVAVADGQFVTSVATSQQGNTSEFSRCILINAPPPGPTLFDFDGDGQADVSVFRPTDQVWYLDQSSRGFAATQWGLVNDTLAPADYDGDGKTDIASWRGDSGDPDLSYFDIINSLDNSVRKEQFGRLGDKPIAAGDWDGDGKADLAVYRDGAAEGVGAAQSNFFYRPSTQPGVDFVAIPWGVTGDKPMRGDFDGDGKLDSAIFRPSDNTWYILQSSDGTIRYESWGMACDTFVPGDYDGDHKTDLAVIRGGTWYIRRSSDGQPVYQPFGLNSDIPVPADYDGDQRTDIAVYRDGDWYILQSQSGSIRHVNFGLAGDIPVESAYTQAAHCAE